MVPLRVISENLGAQVHWQDSQITLAMDQTTIKLNLNNRTVIKMVKRAIGCTTIYEKQSHLCTNPLYC